jgi:hypothetical protein
MLFSYKIKFVYLEIPSFAQKFKIKIGHLSNITELFEKDIV